MTNRKNLYIYSGVLIVILAAITLAVILQVRLRADSIKTTVSNIANVAYTTNGETVSRNSNTVNITVEQIIPTPTPSTQPVAQLLTQTGGSRTTLQRFKLSAVTSQKAIVTFVFDYFPATKSLPSADSVISTTRRLQLTSGDKLNHAVDQSGNTGQYVVGYFEVKVDNKVVERSGYYYLDVSVGSTLAPLP